MIREQRKLLQNGHVVLHTGQIEETEILVQDNRIINIFYPTQTDKTNITECIDLKHSCLFSGFLDVHNHGAIGHDVNASTAEDLLDVAAFLARNGVAAWLPTLVPDSDENYEQTIGEIDRLMELQEGKPVAQAVGVHYEGVFANEKMCGALRPEFFKSGQWSVNGGQLPKLKKGVH